MTILYCFLIYYLVATLFAGLLSLCLTGSVFCALADMLLWPQYLWDRWRD